MCDIKKNYISVAWVRERTIPTERPPLISEVSVNFLRIEGAWRIPTAVISVFQTVAMCDIRFKNKSMEYQNIFLESRERPARKSENLTAICEPIVQKMRSLDTSQSYGSPRPVNRDSFIIFFALDRIETCSD
jgi:hypothetical protein